MKLITIILFIFAIAAPQCSAQIDTSNWFPHAIGDYWLYQSTDLFNPDYYTCAVVKDTLMPNGKVYSLFRYGSLTQEYSVRYYRVTGDKVLRYSISGCHDSEEVVYDLGIPAHSLWPVCMVGTSITHRGCWSIGLKVAAVFNLELPYRVYRDISITGSDTTWFPLGPAGSESIVKGIGVEKYQYAESALCELVGAVLNNKRYGKLVDVTTGSTHREFSMNLANYPNPFNPRTTITYSIEKAGQVSLIIYNVMGRQVAELVNGRRQAGEYSITWNAATMPTGVYVAVLSAGTNSVTKKILLLK